jgi:hypothetical protein
VDYGDGRGYWATYKYGFIDKTGREVVPPKYDDANSFSWGMARVVVNLVRSEWDDFMWDSWEWRFIDKTGKEVILPKDAWVRDISEGMVTIALDGKWGFISLSGTQPPTPTPTPPPAPEYIYDSLDPGASVKLPLDRLATVTNKDTALAAIRAAARAMTAEQKQSATGIDLVTLFAEECVAQAARTTVSGGAITINQAGIAALQAVALDVAKAADAVLAEEGVVTRRAIRADVKLKTNTSAVTITLNPSAAATTADNVRVETPGYAVSIPASFIKAEAGDAPLTITAAELDAVGAAGVYGGIRLVPLSAGGGFVPALSRADGIRPYDTAPDGPAPTAAPKRLKIDFDREVDGNVKISLPTADGDPTYQTVAGEDGGVAVGSKYNPVTETIDVRISKSDTYMVKENKRDFGDIAGKPKEMRDAIEVLASKGIITGSGGKFNPDNPITRAEIAQIIIKTLAKLDPSADGGFSDVKRSDWYFGAAGSAKRHGIFTGSGGRFMPGDNITKVEIVAVAARTLRGEMGYKHPAGVDALLDAAYKDASSIASWGKGDVSLATRENLVVPRGDGMFNGGGTMTRGDAAIILYRMFTKLW